MRSALRAFLFVSVCGCAPSWESALHDYQVGRYGAAEEALRWYAEKGAPTRRAEAERLLGSLSEERERAIEFLLAEARHVRKLADAKSTSYRAAKAFVSAALELLPVQDPRRAAIANELDALERLALERAKGYLAAMEAFGAEVRGSGRCRGAEWIGSVQRLSTDREGAGVAAGEDFLVLYAAEAASKCFELRAYEAAVALSDLAEALRDPESAGSTVVARLSAVAQARLFTEEPVLARDQAADLSEDEVQELSEESVDRAVAAAKPKRRRRRSRAASIASAPEPASVPAPELSNGLDRKSTEMRVTGLISQGEKFQALSLLQELVDENPDIEWLQSLHRRYRADREKLVEKFLTQGERALQREQPDLAFNHYQRVLSIDPNNAIAIDRKRKIENLRKLRQRNEER